MLRRAALAASLLVLLTFNTAAAANGSVTVTDNKFTPTSVVVGFGDQVTWSRASGVNHHTATGNLTAQRGWGSMAWSIEFPEGESGGGSQTFHQAGGWQFRCTIHGSMRGTVNVPLRSSSTSAPLGTTFTLTLGDQALPSGFVHDIQKRKGTNAFTTWKSPSGSTQNWKPAKKGTYQFKTRVRNTANGDATAYSPTITITVN